MDTMQMKRIFSVLMVCFTLTVGLSAQIIVNSADEAINYALKHNYGSTAQQLKVEEAKRNKITANAFLYPSVTAGANGQYNINISETPVPGELVGQPGQTVYMEFGKKYTYSAGLNVNYNVLNWTSVYQSKIANANLQLAQANSNFYQQQLKELVAQNYYAAVTAIQAEKLWDENLLAADTIEMLTQQKFEQGLVDQLAVNQASINRMQVQQQKEKTAGYTSQLMNQLKTLLAISETEELQLTEIPEIKNVDTETVELHPDVHNEVYKAQEKIADYNMKAALSVFAPQVSLKGYFGANQFWNDFDFSFDTNNWRKSNYIGVSVSMPLFTGFANKSKYESAKIQKKIAETAYAEDVANTRLTDNNLLKQYMTSISVVNSSFKKLKLSAENKNLAYQKYNQGLMSLTDYLEFFNADLSLQNQYLSDLSEYRSVMATLNSRK